MAIEITSLFRDILESPEQKQQRQMAEGFARSQSAVSQLTGLATAAAPLVGTMAELQGRRTEDLQRGVGGLLGRDVRSTSEKVSDALKGFNPQDPKSVSQTTQMLQQLGLGPQAAQIASMALEEQQRKAAVDLQAEAARQNIDLNVTQEARAVSAEERAVENQRMAVEEEKRAIEESAFRLKVAEQAYTQAGTQEERDAAKAVSDQALNTLSQLNAGLEISQRARELIDQQARESSREANAASYRAMGPEYEPLAILMETPGSDVIAIAEKVANLSANRARYSVEDYKTLTKDEQTQALTFSELLGAESPLYDPGWREDPAAKPAQLYNQVAIARSMNPNAGMESWVATAAANLKTGIGQVLEDNVDTAMAGVPGANPQSSSPAQLPFDVDAIASNIATSVANPPVPMPAQERPSVNGAAQMPSPSLPSRVPGRSDDVRQAEVAALLTNLTAKNNSDRAAGKPFKTQQELQLEARTRVNQKYSQGN